MAEPALLVEPKRSLPDALIAMNTALRAGDILAIPTLALGLEQGQNGALPNHLKELHALRQLATENQVLLDAVGRGLRHAAARLAEISDAKRGLRTYGPGGATRAWVDQTGQGKRF